MKKIAILFGGRSAEHEVSLSSAKSISSALDKNKFEPIFVFIDKDGTWYKENDIENLKRSEKLFVVPGAGENFLVSERGDRYQVEVVFPVLHGTFGEDGTIQGLFEMAGIPFVSSGVLGSSLSMDKEASKKLLKHDGILQAEFLSFREKIDISKVERNFDYPVFVKPANLGSSVGVNKVSNREELQKAAQEAFLYDSKIIVEEFIIGKEIECSVLGNENPQASLPGEISMEDGFYTYKTKYINNTAKLIIPADLPKEIENEIRRVAVKAFKALCCLGMARVDFFVRNNKEVILNEVNTIPGFTNISMYPKLWEATGISYTDLITKLVELGIDVYEKKSKLKTLLDL